MKKQPQNEILTHLSLSWRPVDAEMRHWQKTACDQRVEFIEAMTIQPDTRKIRLLAADDIKLNQMMMTKILVEKLGYSLTSVSNGQEALDTIRDGSFDVVLMDIQMPVMDGVSAISAIRSCSEPWKNIPIVALTGDTKAEHIAQYEQVGANACVAKPIDWYRLDDVIKSLVQSATQSTN